MPNGRRGPDSTVDFSKFLLEQIEASDEWELHQDHGATTCWEGEARLVIKPKGSEDRIYVWLDERCVWGSYEQMRTRVMDVEQRLKEIGIDL